MPAKLKKRCGYRGCPNVTTERYGQSARERETQACSAEFTRGRAVGLRERLK